MPTPFQIIMQQSQIAAQRDAYDRQRVAQSQAELNNALPQLAHNIAPLMPAPANQVAPIDWSQHDKASAALVHQEEGANQGMMKARQVADDRGRVNMALQQDKTAGQMSLEAFKAKLKPRVIAGGPKASAAQRYVKLFEQPVPPGNPQAAAQHQSILREAWLHVDPTRDRKDLENINMHPDQWVSGNKRDDVIAERKAYPEYRDRIGNVDARAKDAEARANRTLALHGKDQQAMALRQQLKDAVDDDAKMALTDKIAALYGSGGGGGASAAAPSVVSVNRTLGKVRLSDGTVRDATPDELNQ